MPISFIGISAESFCTRTKHVITLLTTDLGTLQYMQIQILLGFKTKNNVASYRSDIKWSPSENHSLENYMNCLIIIRQNIADNISKGEHKFHL